nr:MAG TPA: hypothetical protein [Caudoviricetes sp.]
MILENQNNQENLVQEEEVVVTPKKKRATSAKKKDKLVETPEVLVNEEGELDLTEYIEKWKQEYKRIFKNDIDGETIIWRRLKRGEYKNILKETEEDDDSKILTKQEKMVVAAMLYPFNAEELIEENAGLATVLSEEILARSGFAISYTEEL